MSSQALLNGKGWSVVKMGDISVQRSLKNKDEALKHVVSVTKHQGIVDSLSYFNKRVFSDNLSNYQVIRRGEFAYSTIHLDEGSIGRLEIHDEAALSPIYTVFSIDENKVDPHYLLTLLKSPQLLDRYKRLGSGTVERRKSISYSKFAKISLYLPPIEKQRQVAGILAAADKSIAATEAIINQTKILKQQLLRQLIRFDQCQPLRSLIADISTGVSVKSYDRPLRFAGEMGVLKTSSVSYLTFDPTQNKVIKPEEMARAVCRVTKNSILVSRMNTPDLVGANVLANEGNGDLYLPDRIWRLTVKEGSSAKWLNYVLQALYLNGTVGKLATGTSRSMRNISQEKYLDLLVPNISLDEQERVARILFSIDEKIAINNEIKVKQHRLKKSLMVDLLNAKVPA